MSWRGGLFLGIVAVGVIGYLWMFAVGDSGVRGSLGLLTVVFALLTAGVFWRYRDRLTERLVTANLALGSIVHLAIAAAIVATDRLWELGVLPALQTNWQHFAIGAFALAGSVLTWTAARGRRETPAVPVTLQGDPEPPPPPSPKLDAPPDWSALAETLEGDSVRLKQLQALERLAHVLSGETRDRADEALRVVYQEALRLQTDAAAAGGDDEDVLTQAASLLEWGAQKLPELAELDVSDLLMAKAVADIRAQHDRVQHVFVDHRLLLAIHPIDRPTAEDKCEARAQAARDAMPLLEANGMRLSEDLIAAHDELEAFRSVTGFQVVRLPGDRYVTFEGNGRREALQRALGDRPVEVEVRHFVFDDPETARTIARRVERVRSWKNVED